MTESHILIKWAFTVTLTLKTANHPLCTGSAVQKISFPQTFTDVLKFCYDLDLEQSNSFSFFFHKTSGLQCHKTKSGCKKDQQFETYSRNSHILIIWALSKSFLFFFLHDAKKTLLMNWHHIWYRGKGANIWYDGRNSHILIIWPLTVTLKIANNFLCFFSHYTLTHIDASSYKVWLVAQKILFRQIFIDILEFRCDFDHLVQKTLAYNKIP